jgi:hypothetical protein
MGPVSLGHCVPATFSAWQPPANASVCGQRVAIPLAAAAVEAASTLMGLGRRQMYRLRRAFATDGPTAVVSRSWNRSRTAWRWSNPFLSWKSARLLETSSLRRKVANFSYCLRKACQTTYYLNGHSFIEQEPNRAQVGFRKSDNAFLAVDDVTALQATADRLSPDIIRKRLDYWTLILGPKFSVKERNRLNLSRFYAIAQIEYCRNFIFKRNFPIRKLFERSCDSVCGGSPLTRSPSSSAPA